MKDIYAYREYYFEEFYENLDENTAEDRSTGSKNKTDEPDNTNEVEYNPERSKNRCMGVRPSFDKSPHPKIHMILIEDIKKMIVRKAKIKNLSNLEIIEATFESSFDKYDELLEYLEMEEEFNSFTLLGYRIERSSVINLIVFLATGFYSFYDLFGG